MKRYLLFFTALYLVAEVTYNLGLIEFLSSKNTTIDVYSHLETFGKALSSFGFAIFIARLLNKTSFKIAGVVLLAPCLFFVETFAFNQLLDRLPPTAKVYGYMEGVYRNAVINGNIDDPRFHVIGTKEKVELATLVAPNNDVSGKVDGFLGTEISKSTISDLYQSYSGISAHLEPLYANYALASKRYTLVSPTLQPLAMKRFQAKSGGIAPGLSLSAFETQVAGKSESFKAYSNSIIIPGNDKLGISELKASDIPLGMSEDEFISFVGQKLSDIASKTKISVANIDHLPHSRALIASAYIPPIAIGLSLLSIILNLCSLLAGLYRPLGVIPVICVVILALSAPPTSNQNVVVVKALHVETSFAIALSPWMGLIHLAFIDDKHPDQANIIRIKKPSSIDFTALQTQMEGLAKDEDAVAPVDDRVTVDTSRLTEQGYFGSIKVKKNPYQ